MQVKRIKDDRVDEKFSTQHKVIAALFVPHSSYFNIPLRSTSPAMKAGMKKDADCWKGKL